jgi:hypothetical protein
MLEWIKVVGPLVVSWPVVALILGVLFRKSLVSLFTRLTDSPGGSAEIGPIKIALGELATEGRHAVRRLNRISEVMAESRLLELEITSQMFGTIFSAEQHETMTRQITELRLLTRAGAED